MMGIKGSFASKYVYTMYELVFVCFILGKTFKCVLFIPGSWLDNESYVARKREDVLPFTYTPPLRRQVYVCRSVNVIILGIDVLCSVWESVSYIQAHTHNFHCNVRSSSLWSKCTRAFMFDSILQACLDGDDERKCFAASYFVFVCAVDGKKMFTL